MIYQLITDILSVLNSVPQLKAVYGYPVGEDTALGAYPAAIVVQDSFDNSFESVVENMKEYRFKLWIVIGCTASTTETIFTDALPKTVDAVLAAFDAAWNGGTVAGHRARYLVSSGQTTLSVTQNAREAVAELTLNIRVLTTN